MDIALILSEYYKGQEWTIHGNTYEALIWYDEKNSLPKPTLEELTAKHEELVAAQPLKELRTKRNTLLAKTDRYALPDWPHETLAKQTEWIEYRQALRDLPGNTEDPANPVWPVRPDEVVEEETSNVTTEEETSNVTTEEETSNVTTEEETSNVTTEEETSNVTTEEETSNVTTEEETSNVTTEEETSNVTTEEETSNVTTEEETSNVTTEEETSNVTTEEETSNVTTEEETSSHT